MLALVIENGFSRTRFVPRWDAPLLHSPLFPWVQVQQREGMMEEGQIRPSLEN